MKSDCYICHIKTAKKLIEKHKPEQNVSEFFMKEINELLNKQEEIENPLLATKIHRLARNIIKNNNLFKEEKFRANEILLESYHDWENLVKTNSNSLFKAAQLAVAGNIIDYGAHSVPDDIEKQIKLLLELTLAIDETPELFEEINKSKSILYIGDNAGEIVFDKLFIETMRHPNITYVVRGKPVINDITFIDAQQTGITNVCKVISNGNDAPSTLLDFCSDEFMLEFNKADLIISKGQGNFEGLMNCGRNNLFFMLMAKCEPMAELLGVKKGDMVIQQLKT